MGATSKQSNKPAWYNEESNKRHNEWLAKKERIRKLTQENFARYKQQKEEEKKKASSVTGSKSTYQPAKRPDTVQQTPKRDYQQPQSVRPAVMSRDEEIRKRFEDSQAGRRNDAAQAAASGMMGVPAGASPMIRSGEELQDAYLQSQGIDPAAAKAAQGAATAAGQTAQKKQLLDPKSGKPLAQQYQDILGANKVITGKLNYGGWASGKTDELLETLKTKNADQAADMIKEMKNAGYWDEQGDPQYWSSQKRAQAKEAYTYKAESLQKQIDQLNAMIASGENTQDPVQVLLDLYDDPKAQNERMIISGDGYSAEDKQRAQDTLTMILNKTKGIGSQSAVDRAKNFIKYNRKNLNDYRDRMNMDSVRRMVYDNMNGNGAYDSAMSEMSEEEQKNLNSRIDNAIDYITDPNGQLGVELRNAESLLRTTQDQLQKIEYLDKQDKELTELMEGVKLGDTEYHQENDRYTSYTNSKGRRIVRNGADAIYTVLGGNELYKNDEYINQNQYYRAVLMDDAMQDTFMSYYNAGQYDEAMAFYNAVKKLYIDPMYSMYEKIENNDLATRLPVTSSIATVGASMAQPFEFAFNLPDYIDALVNGKQSGVTSAYGDNYAVTRFKNQVREKITEDLGDWGWVYQGGMSSVDSFVNMMLFKGLGAGGKLSEKAIEAGTLALFSTEAFETSLQNNLAQNNGNFAYDVVEAALDAAIETATEKWSVEKMMSDPKNIVQYIGKLAISEPSEEVVGEIFGPYIKEMLGHKNEWKQRADDIYAAGGYTDSQGNWVEVQNIDQATRQAMREWNHQIRMAAQEALVSVAPGMVYATGSNMMRNHQLSNLGKNISEYKQGQMNFTPEGMQNPKANVEGKLNLTGMNEGTGALVEQGLQMDRESEAYQQAQKIQEAAEFGKKIRNLDVGKLGVALRQQIGQNAEEKGAEARQQLIADRLEETDEEKKAELSRIVDKASREGLDALTRKEQKLLKKNPGAFSVYEELTAEERNETQAEMETAEREATKDSSENLKKVDRIALVNNKYVNQMREKLQESEEKTDAGQKLATQEEIDRASGKRTGAQNEAIVYTDENPEGAVAQLDGIEKVKDGNRTKVMFRVTVDGKTQLMDPTEVKATNFATAAMLQQSVTKQGVFSDKFMNNLMELQKKGRVENVGSFLRDATRIRFAAYIGESVPFTDMPEEVAKDLWLQSVNEAKEQREAEVQKGTGRTKGKATYQGAEYGTEAWNKKIKEQLKSGEMNRQQAQQIDAIAGIAQRAGIEVNFRTAEEIAELEGITAEEAQKIYGSQSGSTININLDAKDYSLDENNPDQPKVSGKHHMLVTFGHEFTHWLQENSLQGYNQLRNFVIEEQKSRGVNVSERLMTIMDNWGQNTDLDINGAIAEMVANSCDQILGNEEVARRLQETKPKLYEQIRNFVTDLVDRIKSVKAGMFSSASRDSWYMMAASANRMAKVWLGAYDEALGRETEEQKAQADNQAYSMSELTEKDKAYADAVKRGDMQTATDMLMEKLEHSENIIPYNAPHGYAGQHVDIAQMIKNGTPEAVARAAADMATYVPDNAVLVPMPNHHGVVNADTDTMILAKAISEITGRPVINALEGAERESRFAAKQSGRQGAGAEELGFRQVQELPEGTIPIFIDNVVGTGVTAQAAEAALGGGITLAYAKSTRSKGIQGLKQATVTYDRDGNLIPLSQRFDASVRDPKYSVAEKVASDANAAIKEIDENWTDDETKSVEDTLNLVGNEYKALSQWLHNTYEKGYYKTLDKPVNKSAVLRFIQKDTDLLMKNMKQIENKWRQLLQSDYKPSEIDVSNKATRNTGMRESAKYLKKNVLDGKTEKTITNKDTSAKVRVDEETFVKSLIYNKQTGMEYGETEKILEHTIKLLEGAVYIGSHDNYAHPGYMVHYLTNMIKDGENKVVVFAVHDATDNNQKALFGEKAYLAEIMIEQNEDAYGLLSLTTENGDSGAQFTNRIASSNDSILSMINAVNPTRIRYFDKTKLAGQTVNMSMAEPNMDVANWMEGLTPGSLRTESERQLLQAYKDLRMKIRMSEERQRNYQAEIGKLEARQQLDAEDRDRLIELRNKLQVQQEKQARLEEELYDVTSSEGYAGMMHYTNKTLQENVLGKNQAQVQAAVDTMVSQAEAAKKNLEKQEKKLKQMADTAEIRTAKGLMRKLGLQGIAKDIKTQLNTTMSQTEIENRMAEIALRQLKGENVQDDITALAEEIMTTQAGYGNEEAADILRRVRGRTIVIGPAQQAEMKGQHVSLKDIREMTKGSGVKFEYGDTATLSGSGLSELLDEMPELRTSQAYGEEMQNETSNVIAFANYIQDKVQERRGSTAAEGTLDRDMVELTLQSLSNILAGGQNGEQTARQMLETINSKRGEAETALKSIQEMKESIDATLTAGKKANMWAQALTKDMDSTIEYFNKTAKWAAEVERQKVRENVIETLKSENTRKLIEQQEKYKKWIKDDRTARGLHEDNESLRRQIHTVIARIKNLLTAETDQKNIQEEAKPLARFLAGLIMRHDANGFRKVTYANSKQLMDAIMRLDKLDEQAEPFDVERDLDWAVIKAPNPEDNDYTLRDKLVQDLIDIETGLLEYRQAEGRGTLTLQDRKAALQKVQEAASEIWGAIKARSDAHIAGQKYNVFELAEALNEDAEKSTFKGERKGFGSKSLDAFWNAVGYGNITPEYFIKNLKNRAMTLLHKGMQDAEQRGGLEARKAQKRIEQIAKDTGYATWDGQEKHEVRLENGRTVTMTTEQIMALYATWKRESNALRPEETSHLLESGFVLAQNDEGKGLYRRERNELKPIRVKAGDLNSLGGYLTDNQLAFVDAIVDYMSGDLAQLGNEASLKTYGIKKFTEQYYFPIKSWEGVLNKSSASGTSRMNDNRAMRQSFTKRIINNANNAVEISDFTPTAMKHIVGMINFNTVGPAVENMNKVLNQKLEFDNNGETYKRNMRAVFEEKYGKAAYDYLVQFMDDVNGGVARRKETSLREKLLSVFRKGAVAGSLSVAAQQPLSYIRAAMMINPKYLAQAMMPQNWKKINQEMMDYSGLAVIKDMGRFDMNFGRSMQDYITPDGLESAGRKAWNRFSEATTILPKKMDDWTWGRIWIACKLEQAAQNPGMDTGSEEFLNRVAERFNDVIRKTQVYDSVMTKSANMRSTNWRKKIITSFMAEPTLSLNVLADAVQNVKEKGGKANLAKAGATFTLSAVMQALVKSIMASGRTPDKKKTWEEQFLTKWFLMTANEMNPLNLIPGYGDMIEVLKKGELKDDAMSVLGKLATMRKTLTKWIQGDSTDVYRNLEDTLGQFAQFFTNVPLKNLMRDARAMYNFFNPDTYANRVTNMNVVKAGIKEGYVTGDNLTSVLNTYLTEAGAGYGTAAKDYYRRIYEAEKAGNQAAADEMKDYMMLVKINDDNPEKKLNSELAKMAKKDDDLTAEEKAEAAVKGNTPAGAYSYVIQQVKNGELTDAQAREKIKEIYPDKSDDDIWWSVDRAQYAKETGAENVSGKYYRLKDAVNGNRSAEIRQAVDDLVKHGVDREDVRDKMSDWKSDYLAADSKGKTRIRNAIQLVYKELGYTAEDADKMINKWKKKDGSSENRSGFIASAGMSDIGSRSKYDTTGRYGEGTIDLNNRKVVENDDGSFSTELSFSFYDEDSGKEVLIPTVIDGRIVSEDEAIDHYYETVAAGKPEYLGMFDTPEEADEYAEMLHERQEWYYNR